MLCAEIPRRLLLLLGMLTLAGCGSQGDHPEIGTVTGAVTLDGKPLTGVIVGFELQSDTGGRPSIGRTDDQGRYKLSYNATENGALIGTHKVTVTTPLEAPDPGGKFKDPIPAKYNTASTLTREVKSGSNVIDLELTTK